MIAPLIFGLMVFCLGYVVLELHEIWQFVKLHEQIKGQVVPWPTFRKSVSKDDKFDWFYVAEGFSLTVKYYLCDQGPLLTRIFGIPAGYATNFVSCPRVFWPIIPPHGRASVAATVHDFLYEKHYPRVELPENYDYRRTYDVIFLSILTHSNLPTWQCFVMYCYVRAFGWVTFKKKP